MSLIGNIIKEHVVDPAFRAQTITMMCIVVEAHGRAGTISIVPVSSPGESYDTENTMTSEKIEDISILNATAIRNADPMPGDYVYLSFIDNELTSAIMIALIKKADANKDDTGADQIPSEATQAGEINYSVTDIMQNVLGSLKNIFKEGERSPGVRPGQPTSTTHTSSSGRTHGGGGSAGQKIPTSGG